MEPVIISSSHNVKLSFICKWNNLSPYFSGQPPIQPRSRKPPTRDRNRLSHHSYPPLFPLSASRVLYTLDGSCVCGLFRLILYRYFNIFIIPAAFGHAFLKPGAFLDIISLEKVIVSILAGPKTYQWTAYFFRDPIICFVCSTASFVCRGPWMRMSHFPLSHRNDPG